MVLDKALSATGLGPVHSARAAGGGGVIGTRVYLPTRPSAPLLCLCMLFVCPFVFGALNQLLIRLCNICSFDHCKQGKVNIGVTLRSASKTKQGQSEKNSFILSLKWHRRIEMFSPGLLFVSSSLLRAMEQWETNRYTDSQWTAFNSIVFLKATKCHRRGV